MRSLTGCCRIVRRILESEEYGCYGDQEEREDEWE